MQVTAAELDQLERGWPDGQIIEVDAAAVSQYPALTALRDRGYEFRWVQIPRVRPLTLSGWEPAFHDPHSRKIIYVNRAHTSPRTVQELILITRNPLESLAAQASTSKPSTPTP
jgi:hypothetical protein